VKLRKEILKHFTKLKGNWRRGFGTFLHPFHFGDSKQSDESQLGWATRVSRSTCGINWRTFLFAEFYVNEYHAITIAFPKASQIYWNLGTWATKSIQIMISAPHLLDELTALFKSRFRGLMMFCKRMALRWETGDDDPNTLKYAATAFTSILHMAFWTEYFSLSSEQTNSMRLTNLIALEWQGSLIFYKTFSTFCDLDFIP
jgi:hypothetical protein